MSKVVMFPMPAGGVGQFNEQDLFVLAKLVQIGQDWLANSGTFKNPIMCLKAKCFEVWRGEEGIDLTEACQRVEITLVKAQIIYEVERGKRK